MYLICFHQGVESLVFVYLFVFVQGGEKQPPTESGKNTKKQNFIEMLNKDKAEVSPAMDGEEGLGIGSKRETRDCRSPGLAVSV